MINTAGKIDRNPKNDNSVGREEWIDYLRGFGIILMFIGHTNISSILNVWIYGFHMPLFYIVSGYLFDKGKWVQAGFKKLVCKRIWNYIIPYFIWCGICFVINLPLFYNSYHGSGLLSATVKNIGWILTSTTVKDIFLPQNCTPLWFLTSLFICQLVFYWLVKLRPFGQCCLVICFFAVNYLLNIKAVPVLPWHLEISLVGSAFMMAGYYIRDKGLLDKIHHILIVALMAIAASVLIIYNGRANLFFKGFGKNMIVFIAGALLMVYVLMWIFKKLKYLLLKKVVIDLGTYSVFAMGLNFSIISYSRLFLRKAAGLLNINMNILIEFLLPVINILICLLAIQIYKKLVSRNRKWEILTGRY